VPPFLLPPEPITSLDEYLATDTGGLGLKRATEIGSVATIAEVAASGLRGRGGAGFPTGRKWQGVADQPGTHHYVVVNGAEGEPGTFKDRALMRANPYQLVEGALIAAFAMQATDVFIGLKARFTEEREAVTRAVAEMQEAGICRDCTVNIVAGPDDYLFGEEKAMLEVIEGKEAKPRLLPPYEHGLFATAPQMGWESGPREPGHPEPHLANPTLVNNVETISNVPHLLARGADWYRSMGTEESPGTLVTTVVGDVVAPDVGEVEMGTPLAAVIDAVGSGLPEGRTVKAVLPGAANPVVTADHLDVPLTYEHFRAIGSGLGAGGYIVCDDTACMVEVARAFSGFLAVESCGQCPPCKLGSEAITTLLAQVEAGEAAEEEVGAINAWLAKVTDGNRCYLAVQEQVLVASIMRAFAAEVVEHLEHERCPRPRPYTVPKLADLRDGHATYV
jgi:NADH:ubiquinone oxidoreductase subunit F (NADH-binding)